MLREGVYRKSFKSCKKIFRSRVVLKNINLNNNRGVKHAYTHIMKHVGERTTVSYMCTS